MLADFVQFIIDILYTNITFFYYLYFSVSFFHFLITELDNLRFENLRKKDSQKAIFLGVCFKRMQVLRKE